ncbi:DoxX family protein [Kutzneria chonburiensis]|uniref:DoxX family protein n=1 Tax=Kutzneria chonburiensis TaxID=1483604 RepID=A0ABV6MRK6_9PSEU|nr:DoxX family protein [Kutzneria chonburiensis]
MEIPYVVVATVLAAALVASGLGKLTRAKAIVDSMTRVGVPLRAFPPLALCELAGAAGLVVGIWRPALGIAAAVGVILYFVLAAGQHVRRKDIQGTPPAVVLLILAVVALVLRLVWS